MNYFKFFSIVTIAVILGLTSCKEGDTDTRELTGTWKTMNKDDYNIQAEGTGARVWAESTEAVSTHVFLWCGGRVLPI